MRKGKGRDTCPRPGKNDQGKGGGGEKRHLTDVNQNSEEGGASFGSTSEDRGERAMMWA